MAQTVIESKDSRSYSNAGGKVSGTAVFHVYDIATPITDPSMIDFGVGNMPDVGDAFPGDPELTASSYAVDIVPESDYVWKVTWTYTSGGDNTVKPPTEVGYIQISVEYGGQFKDMYRLGTSGYPLAYEGGNPSGKDIGGKPIDAAGVPTSVFIPQHRLVIEETVKASEMVIRTTRVRIAVATRNSTTFQGAAVGTLLYEGASARRVSLTAFMLTHKFLYDAWYHMGQQPRLNSQREPVVSMGTQPYAEFVRFVQPFPNLTNFNALSENF